MFGGDVPPAFPSRLTLHVNVCLTPIQCRVYCTLMCMPAYSTVGVFVAARSENVRRINLGTLCSYRLNATVLSCTCSTMIITILAHDLMHSTLDCLAMYTAESATSALCEI